MLPFSKLYHLPFLYYIIMIFMKIALQNQNFSLKFLTPLFLIVCYWFYLNTCLGFLEGPPEKNPRMFIKGNEDIELYVLSPNKNEYCVPESTQKVEKSNLISEHPQTHISRKCDKKFIPLKARTQSLSDLRRQDSTENREKAAPYINRYEERRKRIMNKRQSCSSGLTLDEK